MRENSIVEKITNDFYDLVRLPIGESSSLEYMITLSYSIANMTRLLDMDAGNDILKEIGEETLAYEELLKETTSKGDNEFDRVAITTKFVTDLNNDLKISLCTFIGDILNKKDILR